jgi:L-ascorbate metabolism protein UlaG (beta-lactamase superfamily)
MDTHHLRNATVVIESGEYFIRIDPMLGPKGSLPPFARIRFKSLKNPLVDLPPNTDSVLDKVTKPDEPSIHISGDTVYTPEVDRALRELKPDIAVMAAGTATLDITAPILMTMDELLQFTRNAPRKVIANHLEALNHCPTTRKQLKQELESKGLLSKVVIPNDGNAVTFEKEK